MAEGTDKNSLHGTNKNAPHISKEAESDAVNDVVVYSDATDRVKMCHALEEFLNHGNHLKKTGQYENYVEKVSEGLRPQGLSLDCTPTENASLTFESTKVQNAYMKVVFESGHPVGYWNIKAGTKPIFVAIDQK